MQLYSFHGRGTLNGTLPHQPLFGLCKRTAQEEQIPLQRFAALGIITDAAYLQLEGEGVAVLEMGGAYAFGELLVLALYARYEAQPEGFADAYIGMLTAGGSDWPEKVLAPIVKRPLAAGVVILIAVAVVFSLLLQAGPPTEWFA